MRFSSGKMSGFCRARQKQTAVSHTRSAKRAKAISERAVGVLGFILALLLLAGVIIGLTYLAIILIQSEREQSLPGTFSIVSWKLLRTSQTVLAVTIRNNGPKDIILVQLNITNESYTFDLADNPIPPQIQRGFTTFLSGNYQWGKRYQLTIKVKFSDGNEYCATKEVSCDYS